MEGIFSNKKLGRRVKSLVERIVEKQSVIVHQISESEAEATELLPFAAQPAAGDELNLQQDCRRQLEAGAHYLVFQDTNPAQLRVQPGQHLCYRHFI